MTERREAWFPSFIFLSRYLKGACGWAGGALGLVWQGLRSHRKGFKATGDWFQGSQTCLETPQP